MSVLYIRDENGEFVPVKTIKGADGRGITSIELISGTHEAGTNDTYRVTYTDGTTFDYEVYNGADATGTVRYDVAQSLDLYEQEQARSNINALAGMTVYNWTRFSGNDVFEILGYGITGVVSNGDNTAPSGMVFPALVISGNASSGIREFSVFDSGGGVWRGSANLSSKTISISKITLTADDVGALPLTGGMLTGNLAITNGYGIGFLNSTGDGGTYFIYESQDAADPVLSFYGINGDEPVTLRNIQSPAEDHDAANKQYVDSAVSGAVKIETGTYTGTGTYGSDNPCTLTFGFTPKAVFLGLNSDNTVSLYASPYIWGADNFVVTASKTAYVNTVSVNENTMSWYSSQTVGSQLNAANTVYSYVAIG